MSKQRIPISIRRWECCSKYNHPCTDNKCNAWSERATTSPHRCAASSRQGISLLLQAKCSRRFSNYRPCDRYTHLTLSRRNRDGMVRPRNSDLVAFARLYLHCAPRVSVTASSRHRLECSHL